MLDAEAEAPIEPWVGPYVILAHIADGGMGRAYVGRRQHSAELVVVKIRRQVDDPRFSAEIHRRFAREGQVHARLRNRNIAALVDAKPDYLVFEHVAGPSLLMLMRAVFRAQRSFPAPIVGRILKGILAGLHHLHEARDEAGERLLAVHRDVTPANVLINLDGVVKLIDLGLVRAKAGGFRTEMKLVMGTAQYISPEVASSQPPDRRADVYAASVIAYEMLTGDFVMPPGTPLTHVTARLAAPDLPPPSARGVVIASDVEAVIMRGLAPRPGERWSTAHEMSMALGEALGAAMVSEEDIATLIAPSSQGIRATRDRWQEAAQRGLAREQGGAELEHDELFEPTQSGREPEASPRTLVVRPRVSAAPPPVEISLESVLSGVEPEAPYEDTAVVEGDEPTFAELTRVSVPKTARIAAPAAGLAAPAPAPAASPPAQRPRSLMPVLWAASLVLAVVIGAVARDAVRPDPIPPLAEPPAPAIRGVAAEPSVAALPDPVEPRAEARPEPTRPEPKTPAVRPARTAPAEARPPPSSPAAALIARFDAGEGADALLPEARALAAGLRDVDARTRMNGLLTNVTINVDALRGALVELDRALIAQGAASSPTP